MCPLKRTVTKQVLLHVCKRAKANIIRQNEQRFCSLSTNIGDKNPAGEQSRTFVPFDDILKHRRDEAARSVIIQVKNKKSYTNLVKYLNQFGTVKNSFFYNTSSQNNFVLVEFENLAECENVFVTGKHMTEHEVVPVKSPLMWFRADSKAAEVKDTPEPKFITQPTQLPSAAEIEEKLKDAPTLSDEVNILYDSIKLNDLGSRLRFITALQLETAYTGMFPFCQCIPFGSSINTFGKIGCDLDLVLMYDGRLKSEESSRLVFHSKTLVGNNKMHTQRQLETVADIIQYFLPGCGQVKRILQARVPIIRYKQEITGIDCDVSSSNMSGVYMSELLYILGAYDSRVCPVVFAVRYWAKEIGLTNPAPGRWITNFSLTLLVLFYLQYKKMIPTLETLIKHKRPEDTRSFDDVDCSFLRDISFLPKNVTVNNDDTLADLLYGFFQFYSSFDFGSYAISLNSGTIIPKPEYSALYIVNPLEKYLNVSKNVSPEECERIRIQFSNAAWSMECLADDSVKSKVSIVDVVKQHLANRTHLPKRGGMKGNAKFTVQELFTENEESGKNWRLPHKKTN